jgi:hypothetical protein
MLTTLDNFQGLSAISKRHLWSSKSFVWPNKVLEEVERQMEESVVGKRSDLTALAQRLEKIVSKPPKGTWESRNSGYQDSRAPYEKYSDPSRPSASDQDKTWRSSGSGSLPSTSNSGSGGFPRAARNDYGYRGPSSQPQYSRTRSDSDRSWNNGNESTRQAYAPRRREPSPDSWR